jgi:hypothetical protein
VEAGTWSAALFSERWRWKKKLAFGQRGDERRSYLLQVIRKVCKLRHEYRSSVKLPFVKIVLYSTFSAVVYGILHDLVTAHVCVEYFTIAHPRVIESESPIILALVWGAIATWWVGLILGVLLGAAARWGSNPKLVVGGIPEGGRPDSPVVSPTMVAAVGIAALPRFGRRQSERTSGAAVRKAVPPRLGWRQGERTSGAAVRKAALPRLGRRQGEWIAGAAVGMAALPRLGWRQSRVISLGPMVGVFVFFQGILAPFPLHPL